MGRGDLIKNIQDMARVRSIALGPTSGDQAIDKLFEVYNVQKRASLCMNDFVFVHGLAKNILAGDCPSSTPVARGSTRGSLSKTGTGNASKTSACNISKMGLLPLSEENARAVFSDIDVSSKGSIGRQEFHSWLTTLMGQISKDVAVDQKKSSTTLIKHLAHMLQTDERFLAYRSLVHSAKTAALQDNSGRKLRAISAFKDAIDSAGKTIKDDDVLARFQHHLIEMQLEQKHRLQSAMAAAETLQARESALCETMGAASLLCFEPRELLEVRQYKEAVKASRQPFTVHITTLAGPEAHVEVTHEDTIWSLRQRATAQLNQGYHAYQTVLTNTRGKLEDDSATLGECLLCLSQGEEMVATYKKVNKWVELSHPEFKEFRQKQSMEAARLFQAVEEADKKTRCCASRVESMVTRAEAYCHKTWQEATLEDIIIDAAAQYERAYPGPRERALRRMVRALKRRGLVERLEEP